MKVFYTFGTNPDFPFCGGWVEVEADSMEQAHALFRKIFPDIVQGTMNCSDYYTEDAFNATDMPNTGNRGAFCHCKIPAGGTPHSGA